MDTSTIVMMAAPLGMVAIVYFKSSEAAQHGLSATGSLILEITPRMVAAFLLAGMFQVMVPKELSVDGTRLRPPRHLCRHDSGWHHSRGPDDTLPDHRFILQNGSRGRTVGGLSDGVVAIWIATNYNVGNSIPRSKGGCCQICRELLLSFSRLLAVRNSVE
jgi:hypothetical protein